MAFIRFNNCRIVGISAGVPSHVEPTVSTTDQYAAKEYMETTGIIEKRFSNDFTTSDLCLPAAERLIEDLGWNKKDIDALFFVSQTPDYILPATACVLHGKLGLTKSCLSMDISLGCSGWVYGVSAAMGMVESGFVRKVLVMAGDARKHALEEPDQLFGYAGTVTAIEYNPEKASPIYIQLGSDGSGYDAIIRPGGGTRNRFTEDSLKLEMCEDGRMRHSLQTRMKGMDVFAFGITTAPKSIKQLSKEFDLDYLSYDYFVFHQANRMMNETIRKKLKLDDDKVPYSMTHFGNTSSASIPLTIVTQLGDKLEGRKKLIGCAFGVGLSWGTIAFETENIVISQLVELSK
ncbi:MAG: ketoacyl-ACP synthase III [Muribaculaceae bacterium]|nr:ketoacyl-ACP synthase III [Muribaculaceae bacterium]